MMARTIWLIPIGAIAGSAAILIAFAVLGTEDTAPATAIGSVELDPDEFIAGDPIPATGAFSASLAAHEAAAGVINVLDLEQLIARLAAEAASVQRDTELQGFLAQLASLDPRAAMDLIQRLELGDDALVRVFQAWAGSDPGEALSELARLWPPATQRAVAVGMLDVFGPDEAGIDRIAAAFQPVEALSFRIDAIGRLARLNLDAAISAADKFEISATQTIVQQRIATVMAEINPLRGLEYAETIVIPIQRRRYMDRLLDSWAKLDPDGVLAYMATADLTQMAVSAESFRALATINPEQLLALAEKFAPAQRVQAQRAALEALTSLDPLTAYNRVSSLPPSADRDNFINSVAQSYAAQDPEAALAWVMSLEPRSSIAFGAVMSTVAAQSPMRVADAVINEILNPAAANRAEMPSLMPLLRQAMQAKSPEIAQIADRLANHSDPRVRMQLSQLILAWPQADPDAAIAWAMRNPDNLTTDTAPQFAQLLATQNPALARQSLQRMPEALRAGWIQGTATGMARNDLEGTLDWIAGFRDDDVYPVAVESALNAAASAQPDVVAAYLDDFPESLARVAPLVAAAWSARDPQAAANWVSGMSAAEQAQLGNAPGSIASRWAQSDPGAAESWVRDLPRGPARDEGLNGLLQASANAGSINTGLLDDFSSDAARANGVMSSIFPLARSDPDLARQLISQHVTDPRMRAQAEQMLESASNLPAALSLSLPPGVNLPPGAVIGAGSGTCIRVVGGTALVTSC